MSATDTYEARYDAARDALIAAGNPDDEDLRACADLVGLGATLEDAAADCQLVTADTRPAGTAVAYIRDMIPTPDGRGERTWSYLDHRWRVTVTHYGNGYCTRATVEAKPLGPGRYRLVAETPEVPYLDTDAALWAAARIVDAVMGLEL